MSGNNQVQHLNQEDFGRAVLKSQAPTVVDFYADWRGPCRMVGPVIEVLSQEYTGKVNFAKVDTDANQTPAMRFGIMSIPRVMIFQGGHTVDKIIATRPAQAYRQRIDTVLEAN